MKNTLENFNFIKMPKHLIFSSKESNKETLIMKYGAKVIPTLLFINTCINPFTGRYKFSLEEIITSLGYKVKTGKGKSIDQFRQILLNLQQENIITECNVDLATVKSKEQIIVSLDMKFEKNEDNIDNKWTKIFVESIDNILDYNKTKADKCELITLYVYLESRIWNAKKEEEAESFWDSTERLIHDLGTNNVTLKKHLDILTSLGLVYYSCGNQKQNGTVKNMCNVYARTEEDLDHALRERKHNNKEKDKDNEETPTENDSSKEEEIPDNVIILNPQRITTEEEPIKEKRRKYPVF